MVELSEQQKKCLRLVHQGLTSKQIAPLLDTTPGVVDNYINAALSKMGLTSRREAARLLALQEQDMVQQLHLQPEAIAHSPAPGDQEVQVVGKAGYLAGLLDLPPVGGRENDLTTQQRMMAMSRIGFLAALTLLATVVIVQGVITLLN